VTALPQEWTNFVKPVSAAPRPVNQHECSHRHLG
jgi:hypothetical protein